MVLAFRRHNMSEEKQDEQPKRKYIFSNVKKLFGRTLAKLIAKGWIIEKRKKDSRGFYSATLAKR